ncbi:excisionase family DNA-binding protein [Bacillaceae bacterium IKA-2]|jgi:excisionase family DNA binding protein|nr:excisionase family DNA-binding protein [Bacillaceae bacterium IKA-2]
MMYVSVKELSDYLHLSPDYVYQQIKAKNIRAVHDGDQFLVNKANFAESRENIEKEIILWREEQEQEVPVDIDVKDED